MDHSTKRDILIVIDPASGKTGVGAHAVRANNPIAHTFTVLQSEGKTRLARIQSMRAALNGYLDVQLWSTISPAKYRIVGAVMEFPAMGNATNGNSHTTSFVLGMVFYALQEYLVARGIPVIEVLPGESSIAVGAGRRNAPKEIRNAAVALYTGGQLDTTKKTRPRCVGGLLDGCGPDELDAAAAGFAGRQKLLDVSHGLLPEGFPHELEQYALGFLGRE